MLITLHKSYNGITRFYSSYLMVTFVLSMIVLPVKSALMGALSSTVTLLFFYYYASYHKLTAFSKLSMTQILSIIRWEVIPNGLSIRENLESISNHITRRQKKSKSLNIIQ